MVVTGRGDGVALRVERAPATDVDAVLSGAPEGVAALVYGGVSPAELEAAGLLRLEGDAAAAVRFARLFVLPPKAVA